MTRPENVSAVLFGDWHGNQLYANAALQAVAAIDTQVPRVHVGDFGLYPEDRDGSEFLLIVDLVARRQDVIIRVIPGNHEDWSHLVFGDEAFGFSSVDECGFWRSETFPSIRVAPRYLVWEEQGRRFACLSGAASIDYQFRVPGRSWWPQELPSQEDVDALVDLAGSTQIDVLITHDAPTSAIEKLALYPPSRPSGWSSSALEYARISSDLVDQLCGRLAPALHVCGHFHYVMTRDWKN